VWPSVNVIKLFFFKPDVKSNKLECIHTGKVYLTNFLFVIKARANPSVANGIDLTFNCQASLKNFASVKHSSLFYPRVTSFETKQGMLKGEVSLCH